MRQSRSQRRVQHRVQIPAKSIWIDLRKVPAPSDQVRRRRTAARTRPQLGNLIAVTGDDERLAPCDTIKDLSPVVA